MRRTLYEAALRGFAPKVTSKLGSQVLPMGAEAPSPVSPHPGGRWNYVKLVKAAAAWRHVVRGERAIFDVEWSPRMGVSWSGVKRKCIHSTVAKLPLLFSDAHELCRWADVSCTRLRQAVGGLGLAPDGAGLGQMLENATTLR